MCLLLLLFSCNARETVCAQNNRFIVIFFNGVADWLFGFIALTFGNFAQDTLVKSIESPNGVYYAEVIDNDQGALGGNTYVDVYENVVDAMIFKVSKKPQRVYHGKWGEFENMKIYWNDENCLVINSVKHTIE